MIDDCSNDNTEFLLKLLHDDRIRYIKFKYKKGGNFARNFGIKKSRGKYISFLDSDDIFYSTKLETQINNMKLKKSDLDFCLIKVYYNNIFKIFVPNDIQKKNFFNKGYLNELCNGNFISTQSILVSKRIISKYLFDVKMPRLQDYDLILRMVNDITISFTDETLVEVFHQKDSISNSNIKLQKALKLLLVKKYNINKILKEKFLKFIYKYKK